MVEDSRMARCNYYYLLIGIWGTNPPTLKGETGILPVNRITVFMYQGSQDVVAELENKNATVEFTVGEQIGNRNEAIFRTQECAPSIRNERTLYRAIGMPKDANEIINNLSQHEDDESL